MGYLYNVWLATQITELNFDNSSDLCSNIMHKYAPHMHFMQNLTSQRTVETVRENMRGVQEEELPGT